MTVREAIELARSKTAAASQTIINLEENYKRTGDEAIKGYIHMTKTSLESIGEILRALEELDKDEQLQLFNQTV